jgi:trans-2,3-dihydro-3-hydroxyanthranilate isomerase
VSYTFHLVDVFTDRPFAGNQLAVVLDADGLETGRMQAIAREFNFSETTFVCASATPGCDWRVRIFTPSSELPMAGHPTIGTAVVLQALGRASEQTTLELGVGPTPVRVGPGWAEMEQRPPSFGPVHSGPDALAAALSIDAAEIGEPAPQVVSTGLAHLMVPIRSLAAMRALRPRLDLWDEALDSVEHVGVYAFSRETGEPGLDAHCRMFAPREGIPEDPATGSAAGPLGCYLARDAGAPSLRFRFAQGVEMGRPSRLDVTVERNGDGITSVRVGGAARIVAEGRLETHA